MVFKVFSMSYVTKMKLSDYLAESLESRGITTVFELVGGMITHILDSINQKTNINIVSMHHEQAAAFAAEGFARINGLPGIALATSGPGATNLVTGIGSCYFDSVPSIFITGQVNRNEQKGDKQIRQLGFQETNIVSIVQNITKWAVKVDDPESFIKILDKAFDIATTGRPGPVLIDIPMDVQREIITLEKLKISTKIEKNDESDFISRLLKSIQGASKPLILAGGGLRSGQSVIKFRELVGLLSLPVVNSLMGVDILPYDSSCRVGMIGSYGNRWANMALAESDLLIVVGSRLDVRQTGSRTDLFKANRKIFHIDCEAGEVNNRITDCDYCIAELNSFLENFLNIASGTSPRPQFNEWTNQIQSMKRTYHDSLELKDCIGINPNELMHQISKFGFASSAYVVDVGQHQMWAAQSLELTANQRFLTSGGMGAMGFALPAAIGACFATKSIVTVIAGDGGIQLNIQELQTIIRNNLPIKIIVLNNNCHGMVRQFQESYFEKRYQSTVDGYSAPNFAKLSEAYGIRSWRINSTSEIESTLSDFYNFNGPSLLEIHIELSTNVLPKIAFGRPINEMEPDFEPISMEST